MSPSAHSGRTLASRYVGYLALQPDSDNVSRSMALQALLLSRDRDVQRTLRRVLDAANIDVELSVSPDHARNALNRKKYDALLVDCDDTEQGAQVLRAVRQGKSNKSCISFALV